MSIVNDFYFPRISQNLVLLHMDNFVASGVGGYRSSEMFNLHGHSRSLNE